MTRILALLMILFSLGIAVGESLPDDPALDAPVTLAVKGEALTDVMALLQKQTGVRLQAGRDVADQKVTVFVDEKPLRKVMEGISLLLEYHWTSKDLSSGKVYEIWEDEKTSQERKDWYTKALARAWEETDADLKRLIQFQASTPEQLEQLKSQLSAKFATRDDREARKTWDMLRRYLDDPNMGTLAAIYGTLSPESVQAFRSGMDLCFDSRSDEKDWLLSNEVMKQLADHSTSVMTVNGERVPGERVNIDLHSKADDQVVSVRATMMVLGSGGVLSSTVGLCVNRLSDVYPLPGNHLPQEGMESLSERTVSWEMAEIVEEANLPVEQADQTRAVANRSDILALLHKKLGLQIIADHYSEWGSWAPAKDRPLKETLASFGTMYNHLNYMPCQAYSGYDGEFLYMRAKDVRLCNLREIPNRLLRPWQAAYAKQGCLGLNELSEIAQLSEPQMPSTDSELLGIGDRPVTSPVLKLYGLMTPKQRQEAFSGGTKVSAFTPAQRDALTALLPTQKSAKPFQAVVVGIYKDGWRIDKNEPAPASAGTVPVIVVMDDQTTSEEYRYEAKSNGGKSTTVISAKSVQEAWEKVKADNPDARKENLIWVNSRRIRATVKFADGTSTEKSVDIPSRVPYSRVKS